MSQYVTKEQLMVMIESLNVENEHLSKKSKRTKSLEESTKTLARLAKINYEMSILVNAYNLYKDNPDGIKLPDYYQSY